MTTAGRERRYARPRPRAELASVSRRGAAMLIDAVIITGLHTLVLLPVVGVPFTSGLVHRVTGVRGGLLSALIYCAVAAWYVLFTMARPGPHNGQTLGKQLMGIKVVRDDHRQLRHGYIFVREVLLKWLLVSLEAVSGFVLRVVTLIALAVFGAVSFALPALDPHDRGLHDRLLKTSVITQDSAWEYVERRDRGVLPLLVAGAACALVVIAAGFGLDQLRSAGR